MHSFSSLIFILGSVYLIVTLRSIAHKNIFTASLYNIVGTLFHELSHYIVAIIFNAKPVSFSIIPRRRGDDWILGSVTCRNLDWYNSFPVSLAPLMLVPASYLLYSGSLSLTGVENIDFFIRTFISVILLYSAIPSAQDLKVAISEPVGVLIYGGVVITFAIKFFLLSSLN